jgi:hypothetical protein
MSEDREKRRFIKRHAKLFIGKDTTKQLWALKLDMKTIINKAKKKAKEV